MTDSSTLRDMAFLIMAFNVMLVTLQVNIAVNDLTAAGPRAKSAANYITVDTQQNACIQHSWIAVLSMQQRMWHENDPGSLYWS